MKKFYDPGTDNGGGDAPDTVTDNQQDDTAAATPAPAAAPGLTGQLSAADIAALKTKYPQGIYGLQVDNSILYFCRPTMMHLNAASEKAQRDDSKPLDYAITLTELTCIGGDESKLDDDQAMIGLMNEVRSQAAGKKVSLVNL